MGKKVKKKQRIRKRAGKKKKHKKKAYVVSKLYKVTQEGIVRVRKFCPVCGPGVFLAEHSDRLSCGRCGYTKWKKQKVAATPS